MDNTARISYGGSTPGANSNTYNLLNTTLTDLASDRSAKTALAKGAKRYLLSLKNSHKGTLKVYGSSDRGVNWIQLHERYFPPATTRRTHDVAFRVDIHADIKVDWVNGGSAQTTWYVAQGLADDLDMTFDEGADAFDYIVNGDMESDITGPAIKVGPLGELTLHIQSTTTDTPIGRLSLQCSEDGTDWDIVTAADTELPGLGATAALAAADKVCFISGLSCTLVRVFWDNTSAGSGTGALLNVQARSR